MLSITYIERKMTIFFIFFCVFLYFQMPYLLFLMRMCMLLACVSYGPCAYIAGEG